MFRDVALRDFQEQVLKVHFYRIHLLALVQIILLRIPDKQFAMHAIGGTVLYELS
jgi:hypothetical protein